MGGFQKVKKANYVLVHDISNIDHFIKISPSYPTITPVIVVDTEAHTRHFAIKSTITYESSSEGIFMFISYFVVIQFHSILFQ